MRDEKTRQFNMKQFEGLFTPKINCSTSDLVVRGRKRINSVAQVAKSQERVVDDDECSVFEILSKDASRRSRIRS